MLCWNVYRSRYDKKIEPFNVFDHSGFYGDCVKAKKKYKDKESFSEEVRKSLLYYFWAKCEWEIVLERWPDGEWGEFRTTMKSGEMKKLLKAEDSWHSDDINVVIKVFPERDDCWRKVDVYEQVMNNWHVFVDYLWEHRNELKARD